MGKFKQLLTQTTCTDHSFSSLSPYLFVSSYSPLSELSRSKMETSRESFLLQRAVRYLNYNIPNNDWNQGEALNMVHDFLKDWSATDEELDAIYPQLEAHIEPMYQD